MPGKGNNNSLFFCFAWLVGSVPMWLASQLPSINWYFVPGVVVTS
jgi:hypothetical protein